MTPGSETPITQSLRVLVADEDEAALVRLAEALESLGHEVVQFAVSVSEAAQRIAAEDPDLSFVMVHDDDEHALSLIEETVACSSGPVIAHVNADAGSTFVERAADRGVAAYVSDVTPEVLQGAIEVAMRRHHETEALEAKVGQLEGALARRALIERAKGILMERHSLSERAAFERLRQNARSQGRRVVDVAQEVVGGV